jgi:hypothetical protein
MKRREQVLVIACLAWTAGSVPASAIAAESEVVTLGLAQAKDSGQITAATWVRTKDSYNLQLVLPAPVGPLVRSGYFIGNTIENLRGLDPFFLPGRTLTLVDGRRTATGGNQGSLPAPVLPASPLAQGCLLPAAESSHVAGLRNPDVVAPQRPLPPPGKVQVWLLRADGAQNLPGCQSANRLTAEYLYRFRLVEGAQAVAVTIRVDDEYYVETLQPLEPKGSIQ